MSAIKSEIIKVDTDCEKELISQKIIQRNNDEISELSSELSQDDDKYNQISKKYKKETYSDIEYDDYKSKYKKIKKGGPLHNIKSMKNEYEKDALLAIQEIVRNDIITSYKSDLRMHFMLRNRWNMINYYLNVLAKSFTGITTLLAFSAGFFQEYNLGLSFSAGCFGVITSILIGLTSYAMKNVKDSVTEINKIMMSLGVDKLQMIGDEFQIERIDNLGIRQDIITDTNHVKRPCVTSELHNTTTESDYENMFIPCYNTTDTIIQIHDNDHIKETNLITSESKKSVSDEIRKSTDNKLYSDVSGSSESVHC